MRSAYRWLLAGSLVAAACRSFEGASPPEGPGTNAPDAADADATTAELDGNMPSEGSITIDGAVACPPGAACYEFEGNNDGVSITGDCAIVDTVAHRGNHSAHCKGPTLSYFEVTKPFPTGGPTAFRAFVRGIPPSDVESPSVGYVGLLDTSLNAPRMMVGDVNTRHYDLWWISGVGLGWISSQVADGSPSWTCVEAVFALPSNMTYFVNGTQIDSARVDAELGSAPLSFRWGLPYMVNPAAFEVYVDDIAIGTTRIGCQ